MAVLGANQYGKAESRVVRIVRDVDRPEARHEIVDLNVSSSLRGDFEAAHVDGEQSAVLPTDTQKNTAFAYAKLHGVSSPEDYALALGRRLLEATPAAQTAQVRVEQYAWNRLAKHAFVRRGGEVRTCVVTVGRDATHVVSGLQDLVVLKSTGSEFKGFLVDEFTTLAEADDRILATSLVARWRHEGLEVDWNASYDEVRDALLSTFATTYSPGSPGDAVPDGLVRGRHAARHRRDPLLRSQQAPLPGRLLGIRRRGADQRGRGVRRRRPPVWPDRVPGVPRGGAAGCRSLARRARLLLMDLSRVPLLGCLSVPRWADDVLAGQPYADRLALLARADAAARTLTDEELDQALAAHPRIGERHGPQMSAASQREQAGVDPAVGDTAARLAAGNAAYEQRFGRVFLIRAAGRDAEEILAELDRRLGNDDEAERAETVDNLRQIALLRLEALV